MRICTAGGFQSSELSTRQARTKSVIASGSTNGLADGDGVVAGPPGMISNVKRAMKLST